MGFKDFGCFNSTLLAKQLWRILTVPKSLVATILKEKYFQYGNLTEAPVRENSSQIQKIMISARDLLEAGIIWRIGNNTKITFWEEKWLPSPNSFQVQSPLKNLVASPVIKDLLEKGGLEWNRSLILDTFRPEEVDIILSILFSRRGGKDKLIWGLKAKGTFTIKSAYYAAVQGLRVGRESSSNEETGLYKSIQSLDVPEK